LHAARTNERPGLLEACPDVQIKYGNMPVMRYSGTAPKKITGTSQGVSIAMRTHLGVVLGILAPTMARIAGRCATLANWDQGDYTNQLVTAITKRRVCPITPGPKWWSPRNVTIQG
jgi:hypothetical protein